MHLSLNPLNPTGISTVEIRMDSCDVQTVKGSDPAMPTTSFLMAFHVLQYFIYIQFNGTKLI